jgi:rRNA processing protein Gar1
MELPLAEALQSRGGATVVQPRGERVGRIVTIVGTLQMPVAVVELDARARGQAIGLRDRELYVQ